VGVYSEGEMAKGSPSPHRSYVLWKTHFVIEKMLKKY
jgi:hypothetical protein